MNYSFSLQPLTEASIKLDLTYFMCAGFEDRSLGLMFYLKEANLKLKKIVVIEYLPFDENNKLSEVLDLAKHLSIEPIVHIKFDRYDPQNSTDINPDELIDLIGQSGSAVDISGMSRFLIVILCVRLLRMNKLENLVYFEPEDYHPTEKEYYRAHAEEGRIETFPFLSSGLYEILTVDDLTSGAMQGYPQLLVASPTFQPTFLRAILNEIFPEKLILLEGVPPDPKRRWRKEKVRELNRFAFDIASEEDSVEISTADAQVVYEELQRISKNHRYTNRIIIAPAASKMHALGIAAFIASGAQVEVIYPTPKVFEREYTKGVGKSVLVSITGAS